MKKFLLWVFVVVTILLLSTTVAGALDRPGEVRDLDRFRYDPLAEKVYEGTVAGSEHVVDGFVYFPLRISDRTLEVQIGPQEFVEHSGFKLKLGEMVTVVGGPLVWKGRDIVLARKVSNMTSVLVVRDRDGYPMWDMKRPIQMDPERIPNFQNAILCEMIEP